MKKNRDILHGNISQQILLFTYPIILANFIKQLYEIADGIVLGKFVSTNALAAVGGSATMIINMINNFITGLSTGVTVIAAQYYGRGNHEELKSSIKTGMFVCVAMGGLLTAVSCVFAKPILHLMSVPEEIISLSLTYMYCYFASIIPYMIYMVGSSILRATGDTKRPLYFVIVTAATKIVFDILLAGLFKLGVLGTSLATFIANTVCGIIILIIFKYTDDVYQYDIKDFGFDKDQLIRTLKLGVPAGLESSTFALSSVFIQSKINGFGINVIAAYSGYYNVDNTYWSCTNGLGTCMVTMVSQNYGNDNMPRVHETIKKGALFNVIVGIVIGGLCYFGAPTFLSLFSSDPEVIYYGAAMLRATAPLYLVYTPIQIFSSSLNALGEVNKTMTISFVFICVFRMLYCFFAPIRDCIDLIIVFPITWVLAGIAFTIVLFTNKKLKIRKTN